MITIKAYLDYAGFEKTKEAAGIELVNAALTDPEFEKDWCAQVCTENKGFTQREILEHLRKDASFQFRMYSKWWSKVIGYFSGGDTIYVNRKFFGSANVIDRGSNAIHEFSHMSGWSHYGTWGSSVPYTLNKVFEAWAKKFIAKSVKAESFVDATLPLQDEPTLIS